MDTSKLTASIAALEAKVNTLTATNSDADQAAIDDATTKVIALHDKVDKATPKAK
jgi:hypothetical protein